MSEDKPAHTAPSIGVLGCGQWGRNLVRSFAALGALRSACDPDPAKLTGFKRQDPDLRVTTAYSMLLSDPGIQAVVIATPAATHHECVRQALEAGKDVFVEKPLALTVTDGRSLIELAERNGRMLMVGHLLRYHPAIVKLKQIVDGGTLGKILHVHSSRLSLGVFCSEENILWSFAPHHISVILHLLGERPDRIQVQAGSSLQPGHHDVAVATLRFPSGATGHIFVSWLHPYQEQKLVVVGDRGMAVFDDVARERKLTLYDRVFEWLGQVPIPRHDEGQEVGIPPEEPLELECQHFLDCVARRKRPWTDGEEGLAVLEILNTCQQCMNG